MNDPIVAVAAAEVVKLAFNEFIKTSAGETAKKLTGEALTKAGELRHRVVSWFQNKQHEKAEKAIVVIQEKGSSEAVNKLTTYLDDEMEAEPVFAQDLEDFVKQIHELSITRQTVASNIKAGELEVTNIIQRVKREGDSIQTIGKDIEVAGKAVFQDLKQEG